VFFSVSLWCFNWCGAIMNAANQKANGS
jgi:hypothetical protein